MITGMYILNLPLCSGSVNTGVFFNKRGGTIYSCSHDVFIESHSECVLLGDGGVWCSLLLACDLSG